MMLMSESVQDHCPKLHAAKAMAASGEFARISRESSFESLSTSMANFCLDTTPMRALEIQMDGACRLVEQSSKEKEHHESWLNVRTTLYVMILLELALTSISNPTEVVLFERERLRISFNATRTRFRAPDIAFLTAIERCTRPLRVATALNILL